MADHEFLEALAEKLAQIRTRNIATQQELERVSGVDQGTISRILNGRRRRISPRLLALDKYVNMLLEVDDLSPRVKTAAMEFLAHGNEDELLATIRLGARLVSQRAH